MHKLNYHTAPKHWTTIAKINESPNQTSRKYISSMNPGKPKNLALPLVYLIKALDPKNFKINLKKLLNEKGIKINYSYVTDKNHPVGLIDYVEIKDLEDFSKFQRYQLYFGPNEQRKIKVFPYLRTVNSLIEIFPIKKWFILKKEKINVQSFQGLNHSFQTAESNFALLKKPFTFIVVDSEGNKKLVNFENNLHMIELIKLTGKNKFEIYGVKSCKSLEQKTYELILTTSKKEEKTLTITGSELRSKYTYNVNPDIGLLKLE